MKQQNGAALVVVMGLLAVALLVGVASLRSALVDERLAGNYRASVQTQMVEESLMAAIAGKSHAAQRDALFTRLTTVLGSGERVTLKGDALENLMGAGPLNVLTRQLPFAQQGEEDGPPAGQFTVEVHKLDGSRMAVSVGHRVPEETQAQLVFMQTDTQSSWQLVRFQ